MSKSGTQYKQYYCKVWETKTELKGWLSPVEGRRDKAYCKWCHKEMATKLSDLIKHAKAQYHRKNSMAYMGPNRNQPTIQAAIQNVPEVKPTSVIEGQSCLFIAEHTSFLTVNHLI